MPQRLEVKKDDEATTKPSYGVIIVFFLVTGFFGSKVIYKSVTVQKEKDMASDSNLEVTE